MRKKYLIVWSMAIMLSATHASERRPLPPLHGGGSTITGERTVVSRRPITDDTARWDVTRLRGRTTVEEQSRRVPTGVTTHARRGTSRFSGQRQDGAVYKRNGTEYVRFDGHEFEYFGPEKGIINTPDLTLQYMKELNPYIRKLQAMYGNGELEQISLENIMEMVKMERIWQRYSRIGVTEVNLPGSAVFALVGNLDWVMGNEYCALYSTVEPGIVEGEEESEWIEQTQRRFGGEVAALLEQALTEIPLNDR
jgi:hypothetical protein